jgi:protocatechuate 3,4-dioxygenase beta subunit
MERKVFLKNTIGLIGISSIIKSCSKDDLAAATTGTTTTTTTPSTSAGGCIVTPTETEGPYPYPGGEITNPLQRVDIIGGQTGLPLALTFNVVNTNNSCAVVPGARVDIWHCDKDGYYSGYGGQPGINGNQSYIGQTWLRGYQLADANGSVQFTTIYPGWYGGRATHIHLEVFVNNVLKKATQITFPETVSDAVHVSPLYAAHGINTTRNTSDNIFNNSATDLTNETVALSGNTTSGYSGSLTLGIAL